MAIAIALARVTARLMRLTSHHGTALPGVVAERIDPTILAELVDGLGPVVVVLGTNGKTTTTRLLATILERASGAATVTNRSGANLRQGLVSALIGNGSPGPANGGAAAVFEVDELAFGGVVDALRPTTVVILNLLRDQLDRYGEIDSVAERWVADLARLPPDATIVTCGDDPRLEWIARRSRRTVRRFGLASIGDVAGGGASARAGTAEPGAPTADLPPCPRCSARVAFGPVSFGGLGDWTCPSCGASRMELDLGVNLGEVHGGTSQCLSFVAPRGAPGSSAAREVRVALTGSAAGYDVAAAILAATTVGVALDDAIAAVDGATPAFGRLEQLDVSDKHVVLTLAKNPASLAQAAEAAVVRQPDALLVGLSDQPADGRDVSWIWDAALERLPSAPLLTLTGSRADDLLLRFKYAPKVAIPSAARRIEVQHAVDRAVDQSLERVRPGGTLMVLATYTTLLAIRDLLERRGAASVLPR